MEINMIAQTMPKFNETGLIKGHALFNEWLEFKRVFESWADAMEMSSQSKKYKWLLVAGGREILRIHDSTSKSPEEIHELKIPMLEIPYYNNAIYRLDSYFQSKSNPRLERQILCEIKQRKEESFNEFVSRLRTQAIRCGFEEERINEEVFFQILQGARSDKVKQYAATETGKTIDNLISYGNNDEIKQQQYKHANERLDEKESGASYGSENERMINAVKSWKKPNEFKGYAKSNGGKCYRCGSAKHINSARCPAVNITCHTCGKTGHFARVCLKRRKQYKDKDSYQVKKPINQIGAEDWDVEIPQMPKV